MTFTAWIDTFTAEKGFDLDHIIEAEGASGTNFIPLSILLDAIKKAPQNERQKIKDQIIKIDFLNGDVMHFFRHLARAIAI